MTNNKWHKKRNLPGTLESSCHFISATNSTQVGMSSVLTITDREFDSEVLNASQSVLVYFWASWCGPCRLMSPMMDWASQTYGDRLKVVKLEVDPNPETVAKYNVQGVPALLLFKDGEKLEAIEGAVPKLRLENLLNSHLSPAA